MTAGAEGDGLRLGRPALREDETADVCVVGAGIAGLTSAYLLSIEGRSVIVLDERGIGGGETARTTAHLTNEIDDRYTEMERIHGARAARWIAESHTSAIDRIEAIVSAEHLSCDFQRLDGYLFGPSKEWKETLEEELRAARRAGLAPVDLVPRAPLAGYDTGPCLRFGRQGQLHPMKYLGGLAAALERNGGQIFAGVRVEEIEEGDGVRLRTLQGPSVRARHAVMATNTPIHRSLEVHLKQAPYRSYVLAAAIPSGSLPPMLLWDTLDPYHYVRLQNQGGEGGREDLLIVGGEDHKCGQADDAVARFLNLETWARERFPSMRGVQQRWSGQIMESVDGLAFIGRETAGSEVYLITGDSGMGMTHGTLGAMIVADLILRRENPWAALYDPARKAIRAAPVFAREALNVAGQYLQVIEEAEVESVDAIAPGTGAVMGRGLAKVAVYRDESGALHERSALCPHMGCGVSWNSLEGSWDCPCHGSRFDPLGGVLHGPATRDLRAAPEGSQDNQDNDD